MAEFVLVHHDVGVVTLLLNRPDSRNALSHELLTALGNALATQIRPATSSVIITGAGDCFSAGADYRELTGTIKDLRIDEDIAMVTERIRSLDIPVTAVVSGACLGGAVDLALSCDQRVATQHAYFQVPASRLGLVYNPVSVQRMVLRYGKELVSRLLVVGERFDAPAALAAGLVSSVTGGAGARTTRGRQVNDPEVSLNPVAKATAKMIEAIDEGDFNLKYWEQIRREFLSSKERFEAVAAFQSRMRSK